MDDIAQALALAGSGGLVRYAQRFAGPKEGRPDWEWRAAAIAIGTGSFVGMLTLWIVRTKLGVDYVHFAVAVAGYGGPLTLDAFWEAGRETLRRMLGAQKDTEDHDAKG